MNPALPPKQISKYRNATIDCMYIIILISNGRAG